MFLVPKRFLFGITQNGTSLLVDTAEVLNYKVLRHLFLFGFGILWLLAIRSPARSARDRAEVVVVVN